MYIEEEKRNLHSTTYFIDGTIAEVNARIKQISREYPPDGYGTFVFQSWPYDFGRRVKVELRRANSAE